MARRFDIRDRFWLMGGGNPLTAYLPTGIKPVSLVLALDYKKQKYYDHGAAKVLSDLQTYARLGTTWVWHMVGGSLELVEVAAEELPYAVDPKTGLAIGADIMPAVTRSNIRYAPTASQFTTSGATVADLSLNALGNFPSVKVESAGSLADTASTAAADDVALTAAVNYSFMALVQDDGESATIRLGLVGATSGNKCIIEYTFSTNVVSNPIVTGGTFSDLKGELLVDGTHRITGQFTPAATESFGLDLLPYTTTAGSGFTLSAWFVHYWDAQQRGFPTPVLGAQGSTNATSKPTRSDGLLAVAGDRTIVMTYRRDLKNSNYDSTTEWRGAAGVIAFGNKHDNKNYTYLDDSLNPVFTAETVLQWGERTTVALSYESGAISRVAIYDGVFGLYYTSSISTQALDDTVDFFIGLKKSWPYETVGGNYEKALFFDVAMTQAQIEEAVQMGA